jgi:hypothetical protein
METPNSKPFPTPTDSEFKYLNVAPFEPLLV